MLPGVGVVSGDVGYGIDEQLRGEIDAGVATGDRNRWRHTGARAVPGHAHARSVSAEFSDARDDVAHGSEAVIECAGKARFWRAPVVNGDNDGAGLDGEQARLPVTRFEMGRD